MLIYFTEPWENNQESKEVEGLLKDIFNNYVYVIKSDKDIHKYLDSSLDKMFGNNTRSWITTMYSSRQGSLFYFEKNLLMDLFSFMTIFSVLENSLYP